MSAKDRGKAAPRADERPPAPWGSFPLAELTVLGGIIMLVVGVVSKSPTAIGVGVVLAGLGGLEVSLREHLAGYRSHTTLLSGTVFVVLTGGLFYLAGLVLAICLAAAQSLSPRPFSYSGGPFKRLPAACPLKPAAIPVGVERLVLFR